MNSQNDMKKSEKKEIIRCSSGDGMEIEVPEDVAAVLNLCEYELFFSTTFCEAQCKADGGGFREFNMHHTDYDWLPDLIAWVRGGMESEK